MGEISHIDSRIFWGGLYSPVRAIRAVSVPSLVAFRLSRVTVVCRSRLGMETNIVSSLPSPPGGRLGPPLCARSDPAQDSTACHRGRRSQLEYRKYRWLYQVQQRGETENADDDRV